MTRIIIGSVNGSGTQSKYHTLEPPQLGTQNDGRICICTKQYRFAWVFVLLKAMTMQMGTD